MVGRRGLDTQTGTGPIGPRDGVVRPWVAMGPRLTPRRLGRVGPRLPVWGRGFAECPQGPPAIPLRPRLVDALADLGVTAPRPAPSDIATIAVTP